MTPSIRAEIKKKILELHAQIATLTAALGVLTGKPAAIDTDEAPTKPRQSHQEQFDAMMDIYARSGRTLAFGQIKKELKAAGKYHSEGTSTLSQHLLRAVKRGYLLKRADGYRASPTIQKITQKPPQKPHAGRRRAKMNGHSRKLNPELYAATIDIVRAQPNVTRSGIRSSLIGRKLPTTAVNGHLEKAIREGSIVKKGSGQEAVFRLKPGNQQPKSNENPTHATD